MTKQQFEAKCYNAYVLQWLASHEFSLWDVMNQISSHMIDLSEDHDSISDTYYAAIDLFEDTGLGQGSLYVCQDEFLDNEFQDPDYMELLFKFMGNETELQNFYNKNYSEDTDKNNASVNYVTLKVKGYYRCQVPSNISVDDQKETANASFSEADFGELEDIDGDINNIEDGIATFKVSGNYTCTVTSNLSIEEQRANANSLWSDADFGDLINSDAELLYIEDEHGNYIYE